MVASVWSVRAASIAAMPLVFISLAFMLAAALAAEVVKKLHVRLHCANRNYVPTKKPFQPEFCEADLQVYR